MRPPMPVRERRKAIEVACCFYYGLIKLVSIVDKWEFIAERKIREAMAEGAFDNLRGKGLPLDLEENPYEDPSLRMAHRLLRNNGFAPAWIEEAKDLEHAIEESERELLR